MKIITLEEHVVDAALTKATHAAILEASPFYTEAFVPGLPPSPPPGVLEDIGAGRLANMDAHGIAIQVLSHSNSPQLLHPREAIPLVRDANDRLAETVKSHPDRFAAFATLPWSDAEAAAAELERTVKKHGFKGALINGRPGDTFLDDPHYDPVFAVAESLDVPIYTHPGTPLKAVYDAYYAGFDPVVSSRFALFGWGWHAEPGVQLIRMILAGVFDKHPNLQIIAGHWGEMVPFFLDRLDKSLPREVTCLPRTIAEYFTSHVYVTPSGMFQLPHLMFILKVMGAKRIIYSVDYPYLSAVDARAFLENAPISREEKEMIAHGNAERLLKL